ncbi:histone-lysine N-trimethyltransferase SMYD5 [Neodiprion virginianus]|uniref:histone-lysine N-trimethyltransferase SMYD5 n=1 Tax=Neodiprion virginianus TaxID=2961670 RepID=UPI001EE70E6E|nr:histone-lysine N-trimethyltransferase SMYD5 [Neodiprion virginianus]XP_046622669.1 histone-lysine N-trimethyltransferase SMYD5 [Neodiprion virginianus]
MEGDGFEVRIIDEEKGKGIFSLKSFKEGEQIFQEKPVVCCQFSWNAEYGYSACDNCMSPLETAEENAKRLAGKPDLVLPYPECCQTKKESIVACPDCGVKYCSPECQQESLGRYHQYLCHKSSNDPGSDSHPLVRLNEAWKQMHYPPETATIMLLARMVSMVQQCSDKEMILYTFGQFCRRAVNETQEISHNLLGEKYVGQIDMLREMAQSALNNEAVAHWFTPDGFRSILALIGTNGQGIGTSAFSRWVRNVSALELPMNKRMEVDKLIDRIYDDMEEVVGSFLNNEGSGLYKLQSAANHSCAPNAIVEFPYSNSTLVLKAVRDIRPEEEICISYLDDCALERSRYSRQKALSSLYLFICRCDKCLSQADDPNETSDDYDDNDDDGDDVDM